ncbi:GTP pyrophosphokinase [Caloramator mitchellensis]|uniref:GTP pyrophosphokinase n=1 Tax=Caloramator mitchellensis TaxID=908809 RepID=A0A0R3K1H9_CALMK|nr:GNAT family N-acetyltransferase [Caloramator mitchellensis]KRQ87374.1 GTP pyrophosphokinase [Caloramator mitchellensis]
MDFKALKIAWDVHKKQIRKGSDIPYIVHPIEVAIILYENGADDDILNAALLHDTIEDTKGDREILLSYLKQNFNSRVVDLILAASEPYKVQSKKVLSKEEEINTWMERKKHTIDFIKNANLDVKMLICADKLSNIRSTFKDYKRIGDRVWKKFNAGYDEQKWYYENLVKVLNDLEDKNMYKELKTLVENIFEDRNKIVQIKEASEEDKNFLKEIIKDNWGSEIIVSKGKAYNVLNLPVIIAKVGEKIQGFAAYSIENKECELVLLESVEQSKGIGGMLIEKIIQISKENNCRRLFLITTNDNIEAIKFYQKNGFKLSSVYKGAVNEARKIKPQIPLLGNYDIPIEDEIEFELIFS